jgi:hypothetical protein
MRGVLPSATWHSAAAALMIATMAGVALWRRISPTPRYRLLHPRHVREIAHALEELDFAEPMKVAQTSLGIRVSRHAAGFTLSRRDAALTPGGARVLARLITHLRGMECPADLVVGRWSIFHLLTGRAQ